MPSVLVFWILFALRPKNNPAITRSCKLQNCPLSRLQLNRFDQIELERVAVAS